MKYKKYILFQYLAHEACGGLDDIRGSFDSLEEAKAKADDFYDYNEIVDRDTWELVWENP